MVLQCLPGQILQLVTALMFLPRVRVFQWKSQKKYSFIVTGEENINTGSISIIDQKRGYSYSIYLLSVFLSLFLIITFYTTKERITPPKAQETNLAKDLKDLIKNRPWIILLIIGLIFQVYNSIKQGIVVIYFAHYLHNQLLAASYMVALMLASIAGAMITSPLGKKIWQTEFVYLCFPLLRYGECIACFLQP